MKIPLRSILSDVTGSLFSIHYSMDGGHFYMMRFFSLPADRKVRIGLLAQAPVGNGGARIYDDLTLESITVKNIRFGV